MIPARTDQLDDLQGSPAVARSPRRPLNVLQESPLDSMPVAVPEVEKTEPRPQRWVASRFNVQATTDDGRLALWNTYSGAMSVFPATERDRVRSLLTRRGVEAKAEGLVGYLEKRNFLIAEGADELRRFQLRFGESHHRTDILHLTLLASEDCNFRCEYCYEKFARGTMQPWVRSAVKKLVERELDGLRRLRISWFGGEPLYGFAAIEELATYFEEVTTEHSIKLDGAITTNGYLLTPEVVDKLLGWGINHIQVTIDGAPEDHDRLRHTRTGEGTFDRIFDNVRAIGRRSEEFLLQIRVNFDPWSYGRVGDFIDQIGDELGNDPRIRMLLRPVARWGGPQDRDLNICGAEQQAKVNAKLAARVRELGLENYDDLRNLGCFGAHVCYAARPRHFLIGADGKVMKCTIALDTHDGNIVGRLTPEGELDLDPDKVAQWSVSPFTTEAKCQKCVILPVCQGLSCPYEKVRGAETSCPTLRTEAKKSLLAAQRSAGAGKRKIWVDRGADSGA